MSFLFRRWKKCSENSAQRVLCMVFGIFPNEDGIGVKGNRFSLKNTNIPCTKFLFSLYGILVYFATILWAFEKDFGGLSLLDFRWVFRFESFGTIVFALQQLLDHSFQNVNFNFFINFNWNFRTKNICKSHLNLDKVWACGSSIQDVWVKWRNNPVTMSLTEKVRR